MSGGKYKFILEGDLSPEFIEAVANKVIEKTQPDFFKDMETYFTVKEAAKLAECSAQTIGIHIRRGILKASKPGKSYKISETDLKNYINGK